LTRSVAWEGLERGDIETKVRVGLRPSFFRPLPVTIPVVRLMRDLMMECWVHEPDNRTDFKKITRTIKDFEANTITTTTSTIQHMAN